MVSSSGNGTRMHKPLRITKVIDRSSPLLQQAMAEGTTMNVTISLDRVSSDGSRATYFRYIYHEAWPVAIGSQGEDGVPTEIVSFNYRKIIWTYVELGIEYEENGVFVEPEIKALNAYLWIKGIDGEATDEGHKDWIDVLSLEWGIATQPRDAASGLPTGKRQHKSMTITKELDKSSPKLAEALSSGSPLTVSLEVYRAGDDGAMVHYLTINMTGAVMQSMDLDHRGHVTVLKSQESGGHVTVLKTSDTGDPVELETSVFNWSTMTVTFEETGDIYRETWEVPPAVPSVTSFMHVEGISGGSTDLDHDGWIDLASIEWGIEEYIEEATGMPTGLLVASDVEVIAWSDGSTPTLAMLIASGNTVNVTIQQWALNESAPNGMDHVLTLELHNASLMSMRSGGSSDVCAPCTYDLAFSFRTLDVTWELYGIEREGIGQA
ncbi:MAG: type VI secretion system tube protein Hcp [Thermoplasmata archaeon]|nr:type VI secretion system tube protein Hcp [Thermoplasmata archaeon]